MAKLTFLVLTLDDEWSANHADEIRALGLDDDAAAVLQHLAAPADWNGPGVMSPAPATLGFKGKSAVRRTASALVQHAGATQVSLAPLQLRLPDLDGARSAFVGVTGMSMDTWRN
ncbi:uncharacterized protein AMSG_11391 [Thecamonas trahens ATCC 50062]|uniref:Uncharacterized protein n=1 Tax=Thecamonas trahens ATCC 50062 TaxID=461836 RepID=A0A0L0DWL5_THETB|nr:hypothetical protein AMSG_11391 [Thecamonas trahens ATCC 50062]KNC55923.1 hypothetical protein AMSG_11391 [Thecamonas trahens ATCC 50062]|eukprot:XP_013752741.1 hypothetical protein AMSG_11391 [Thecamonas trahens ATCC 50062]